MYRISKKFHFSASHQLSGMPEGHPCSRLHGHNYVVELGLKSKRLTNGMVLDYGLLKPFQEYIDANFDHRHLNQVMAVNPTAELIAQHLFGIAWGLWGDTVDYVRVSETEKTVAEYREDGDEPESSL